MRKLVGVLAVLAVGCGASATASVRPMVAENRRPEARELPPDPAQEPLPDGTPTDPPEDHVEPLEAGMCVERAGIMVSEARAVRDGMYRIRYRELRRTVEADRQVWGAHRELYEEQIRRDREEIQDLRPGFWEEHDGEFWAVVGFIFGAGIVIGLTAIVNEVDAATGVSP